MIDTNDIRKIYSTDKQWYRKIWTLDIQNMSWVEQTGQQVDFIIAALRLKGGDRVLDLACGFGRHSMELARRGFEVTGVDITADYIAEARKQAAREGLKVEFICSDLREVSFPAEFDVVMNLADGAIGYLENDAENLKIFDLVAASLKPGGKHLMDICNGGYAAKHFPKRHWVIGQHSLSLADFTWDSQTSCMYYGGMDFQFGDALIRPEEMFCNPTRLYSLPELTEIFAARGMAVQRAYGDFDLAVSASEDVFQMQVVSQKIGRI
ncbi:MAG TPA: class I SAM-dependent methyltransferase [Anaerolineaceae bacterium]|nr:class I SAM-dependent methyltransferase [Anaerolineaceae bacterium]HPN53076.1 class I SAM-dependent methyltransferase [Anaerolineaceae bacterium]